MIIRCVNTADFFAIINGDTSSLRRTNPECEDEKIPGPAPEQSAEYVKPPLGLIPRFIREEQRLGEIIGAITRYTDALHSIPVEWIEEYNDLVKRGFKREDTSGGK